MNKRRKFMKLKKVAHVIELTLYRIILAMLAIALMLCALCVFGIITFEALEFIVLVELFVSVIIYGYVSIVDVGLDTLYKEFID